MPGKSGTARLARGEAVPITPVGLWGTHRILTKGRPPHWQWGIPQTAVVGEPVVIGPDEHVKHATARLMDAIVDCVARAARDLPTARRRRTPVVVGARAGGRARTGGRRDTAHAEPGRRVTGRGRRGGVVGARPRPRSSRTTRRPCCGPRREDLAATIERVTRTPTTSRESHSLTYCTRRRTSSRVHGSRRRRVRGAVARDARDRRGGGGAHRARRRDRESGQRHRAGNAAPHDRGDRRGARRSRHRPDRRADRSATSRARSRPASRPRRWSGYRMRSWPRSSEACSSRPTLRVYTNPDVVGCEIAGRAQERARDRRRDRRRTWLRRQHEGRADYRGLAELARLGVALGGEPLTFAGLAGMGDLIATCASPQSRNRHVGVEIGRGRTLDEVVAEMNMVAEGVKTTAAVLELRRGAPSRRCRSLRSSAGCSTRVRKPADLVPELMMRKAKPELHGMRAP